MQINNERRYHFIHVPRTGGTSGYAMLKTKRSHFQGWGLHKSGEEFGSVFQCGRHFSRRFFTFGFIRNPWDRLLSLYQYLHSNELTRAESFIDWLVEYQDLDGGRPAMVLLQHADFVGRYESFVESWTFILKHLGFYQQEDVIPPARFAHLNGRPKPVKQRFEQKITPEADAFIRKHHEIDINFGGYRHATTPSTADPPVSPHFVVVGNDGAVKLNRRHK